MRDPTWILAIGTMALAVVTTALAIATVWLAVEARKGSLRQIRVQTWLALEARLDSREIKAAERKLARQLDPYDQSKHDQITEEVLELVESIATVCNFGLLDKSLAFSSFSFYANHWWQAVKAYVDHERRCQGGRRFSFWRIRGICAIDARA